MNVKLDKFEIEALIEAMDQYANLVGQSLDDAPEEDYQEEVAKYQWLKGIKAHLELHLEV
jgi:adenine-specific DNA methylase